MRSYINSAELNALSGLPHEARTLYRDIFRVYMDYATGIAGFKRRFDYFHLAMDLEVDRPAGSRVRPYKPSREAVRHLINLLIKKGLLRRVVRQGKAVPLVFKLPLADSDLSRLEEEQQGSNKHEQQDEQQEEQQGLLNINQELSNVEQQDVKQDVQQGEYDEEQHISDYPNINSNNYIYALPENWLPSNELVERLVNELGVNSQFVKSQVFGFVSYWREQKAERNDWEAKFIDHIKNQKKYFIGNDRAEEVLRFVPVAACIFTGDGRVVGITERYLKFLSDKYCCDCGEWLIFIESESRRESIRDLVRNRSSIVPPAEFFPDVLVSIFEKNISSGLVEIDSGRLKINYDL